MLIEGLLRLIGNVLLPLVEHVILEFRARDVHLLKELGGRPLVLRELQEFGVKDWELAFTERFSHFNLVLRSGLQLFLRL